MQFSFSIYTHDSKIAGHRAHVGHMWKNLCEVVDLEGPAPLIDTFIWKALNVRQQLIGQLFMQQVRYFVENSDDRSDVRPASSDREFASS